jgi:hypothetical protein
MRRDIFLEHQVPIRCMPICAAAVIQPIKHRISLRSSSCASWKADMGMPFPTGLQKMEQWHSPSVRWAWSLNAAASVLGSVGALTLAIYFGLFQTLIIGGIFYLGALFIVVCAPATVEAPKPIPDRAVIAT